MNTIDNGIKKVRRIKKVIIDTEMYFEVTFIDWYDQVKKRKFQNIKDIENKSWVE